MKEINNLQQLVLNALDRGVRTRKEFNQFLKKSWDTEEMLEYNPDFGAPNVSRLISADFHPELPLILLNYTQAAVANLWKYNGWSDTLRQTRGVVFDYKGNIKAIPFPRMDPHPPDIKTIKIKKIEEKLDGHLIIGFNYMTPMNSVNILTTRGFWNTPSASKAETLLKEQIPHNITVMMELISPISRHKVDYGNHEELYYISARNLDGTELSEKENQGLANHLNLPQVPKFQGDVNRMVRDNIKRKNFEGFVVSDEDGNRYKFKSSWFKSV